MLSSTTAIYSMAWPACVRIAQASCELCPSEKILGTSRMPREPSAWQDWQPFLTVSTHCAWLFMAGDILLPLSPVPGNSFAAGISSSEYQYMPGYSCAAAAAEAAGLTLKSTSLPRRASTGALSVSIAANPDHVIGIRQIRDD